jgi:hypothetical protein
MGLIAKRSNTEKLKELILYITSKCQDNGNFGSILLDKLLFYADFCYYAEHGTSISGETYKKEKLGIVPADLVQARDELIDDGKLKIHTVEYFGYDQKHPKLSSIYHPSLLSEAEQKFVDGIIQRFGKLNGSEISDLNHHEVAFAFARFGETIPYNRIFALGKVDIPPDVKSWAIRTCRTLGYEYHP